MLLFYESATPDSFRRGAFFATIIIKTSPARMEALRLVYSGQWMLLSVFLQPWIHR
jgi:hypothetical protein